MTSGLKFKTCLEKSSTTFTKITQKTTSNVTNLPKKITLFEPMTETVNVLAHIKELKDTWRKQNFKFTKDQQLQMDMLMQARRERVEYFYEENLVWKGPYQSMKKIRGLEDVEEEEDG